MLLISALMFWYSLWLCVDLWEQPVAEFPLLPSGESSLPLPVGSAGSESVQCAPVSRARHAPASARVGIALEFALAARYRLTASSRLHSPA